MTETARWSWRLSVPGHAERTVTIEAVPVDDGVAMQLRHPRGHAVDRRCPPSGCASGGSADRRCAPRTGASPQVLGRSVEDLGALRIFDPEHPRWPVVAAGAPWFMALFGRDSLLTAWMLLPWDPGLTLGTLRTLAAWQGADFDAASEEEPGKILHEVRFGPAASFALGGRSAYYGSADATPLFVMLLGELQRWGGRTRGRRALLPHADRALEWIEHYGDGDGDGFVEYRRKTGHGLANQGWKDSWDGINFADGTIAEPPIALAEVQGYVYAAYRARAELAASSATIARGCTGAEGASSSSATSTSASGCPTRAATRRPRRRQAPDRLARPRTSATACGPASPTRTRPRGRRAPDVTGHVHRLGHPHARSIDGRL